jgi:hypothetical protein
MSEDKKVNIEVVVRLNLEVDLDNMTPRDLIDYFDNLFINHPGQKVYYNSSDIELMEVHHENKPSIIIISKNQE